jgi:hypothetical protein
MNEEMEMRKRAKEAGLSLWKQSPDHWEIYIGGAGFGRTKLCDVQSSVSRYGSQQPALKKLSAYIGAFEAGRRYERYIRSIQVAYERKIS